MATSSKFLNSILNILPAIQARQINDLLKDLQAQGQVRNAEEYEKKLKELALTLNSTVPKPSFTQIFGEKWSLCGSEDQNMMMRTAQNDIEAVFEQVNEIGDKVADHHFLMMQNLFADLERGLTEQENKIREFEWLADQKNEFTQVLVNSFKSSSLLRIARSEAGAENLYFDNRTYVNKLVEDLPNAVVSERGQKLILDTYEHPKFFPVDAEALSEEDAYVTEVNVESNNKIQNLFDGENGTFWTRSVYLSLPVRKVTTVIDFDLGAAKDVSYVIIEGATKAACTLEKVIGITPDGHSVDLITTSNEVDGNIRLDFQQTFLRSVKLTFSVNTYYREEYFVDKMVSLHDINETLEELGLSMEALSELEHELAPLAREVLIGKGIIEASGVPEPIIERIDAYVYPLALDNVWFGNSLFLDQGIFVSKPLEIVNIGLLGVRADENIATGTVRDSIEYEIVKIEGVPFREQRFSIPKLDQSSVTSERLILTKTVSGSTGKNAGILRFCPFISSTWVTGEDYPVKVYRDGTELVVGNDFQIAISEVVGAGGGVSKDWKDDFSFTTDFDHFTLRPQKMWVKLLSPSSSSIYTLDYEIRTSDTDIENDKAQTVWLDIEETISLLENGRIQFQNENPDHNLGSAVFLQITLRRNKASKTSSPELNEYVVLAAAYGQKG